MKKIFFISLLALLAITEHIMAQTACFTAEDTTGCTPFTLRIHDCTGLTNNAAPLYMITGPENYTNFDSVYTLTKPGFYSVTQISGVSGGNGTSDTLTKHNYIQVLPKDPPEFIVQTCEGSKVGVKITSTTYDDYSIDFGDGTIISGSPGILHEHTYSDLALKTITVTGKYIPEDCGESNSKTVQPYLTLEEPTISSLEITSSSVSGSVKLSFESKNTFKYKILQKAGTADFVAIDSILYKAGTQNKTLSNLDTKDNPIVYKVASYDDCGSELASQELSTIPLNLINGDNKVDLSWQASIAFDEFEILKNNEPLATVLSSTLDYEDNHIICGNEYCYQIVGKINNTISSSSIECITGQSSIIPPAISTIESGFTGSTINLQWEKPEAPVFEYTVFEFKDGMSKAIGTSTPPSYSIEASEQPPSSCYKVSYKDKCNNTSPLSTTTCPVVVSLEKKDESIILTWSPYTGTSAPTTYIVEKYDESGVLLNTYSTGTSTYFVDSNNTPGKIIYKVRGTGANNYNTFSNEVLLTNDLILLVPNAFSPNGDGVNDKFLAEGKFVKDFKMTIFNNWGEVIYSSNDINRGWDGTLRGTPLVSGSYAFVIEATDFEGKLYFRSGTLTLLK